MSDPSESDIIRKIAALRRLAEKAGTPEEASSAAAKAQELMMNWNIAESKVAGWQPDDLGAFINHEGIVVKQSWRQMILSAVAPANFVRIIRARDHSKSGGGRPWLYRMVGREENIAAMMDQYDWLAKCVDRLSQSYYIDYVVTAKAHGMSVESESNWRHAFRVGCAETIAMRLRAERRQAETVAATSTALIVINKQVDMAFDKFYPDTRKIAQRGQVNSYNAQGAGRAAGNSVGLRRNAGIGGNSQGRIG